MRRYWIGIFGQAVALLKRFVRDKTALFFTFLFPLLFLFVFGSIFNNQTINFKVAIINNSPHEFAKGFYEGAKKDDSGTLEVKDVADMDEALEKLKRSEIDGIIELPADFGAATGEGKNMRFSGTVNVLHAKGQEQSGTTLSAVLSRIVDDINKRLGQPEPPLKVATKPVGDQALKTFDYTFTGLLAFSLMSLGVFGLANQMPTEKQKGAYRRLRASPFTAGQLIIATAVGYTIIALISAASMIVVGMLVFHFTMRGSWLLLLLFMALSAMMMIGMGLAVGSWAKNERQSAPLSNLVGFVMMFLSGVFFPTFLFPDWLQTVSKFVPMTHVVDGFRLIMTENANLVEILPQIGAIALSILVVYVTAVKLFRWE